MTMTMSRLRGSNGLFISRLTISMTPSGARAREGKLAALLAVSFDPLLVGQLISSFRKARMRIALGASRIFSSLARGQDI